MIFLNDECITVLHLSRFGSCAQVYLLRRVLNQFERSECWCFTHKGIAFDLHLKVDSTRLHDFKILIDLIDLTPLIAHNVLLSHLFIVLFHAKFFTLVTTREKFLQEILTTHLQENF